MPPGQQVLNSVYNAVILKMGQCHYPPQEVFGDVCVCVSGEAFTGRGTRT